MKYLLKKNKSIKCIIKKNKILLKKGSNVNELNLFSKYYDQKFFFNCKKINPFLKILKKEISNISFGYFLKLNLKGIGFRISSFAEDILFDKKLALDLGYSNILFIDFKENHIKVKFSKNQLILYSYCKKTLGDIAFSLIKYKSPDNYKGKGIFLNNKQVFLKPGKVRQK